jgi:hypothetical protein
MNCSAFAIEIWNRFYKTSFPDNSDYNCGKLPIRKQIKINIALGLAPQPSPDKLEKDVSGVNAVITGSKYSIIIINYKNM